MIHVPAQSIRTDAAFVKIDDIIKFIDATCGATGRPVTMTEIAENFGISRQATYDRILQLRAKGYLIPQERGVSGQVPTWMAEAVKAAYAERMKK